VVVVVVGGRVVVVGATVVSVVVVVLFDVVVASVVVVVDSLLEVVDPLVVERPLALGLVVVVSFGRVGTYSGSDGSARFGAVVVVGDGVSSALVVVESSPPTLGTYSGCLVDVVESCAPTARTGAAWAAATGLRAGGPARPRSSAASAGLATPRVVVPTMDVARVTATAWSATRRARGKVAQATARTAAGSLLRLASR
jgi:hypothetical protein